MHHCVVTEVAFTERRKQVDWTDPPFLSATTTSYSEKERVDGEEKTTQKGKTDPQT